jgi:hypothetical protein
MDSLQSCLNDRKQVVNVPAWRAITTARVCVQTRGQKVPGPSYAHRKRARVIIEVKRQLGGIECKTHQACVNGRKHDVNVIAWLMRGHNVQTNLP